DPERKRRLNDVAAGMSVVAHHKKDASIEACIQKFFREEIMTCEWYRNALAEGKQQGLEKGIHIGIEKGREEGREALLDTVRMFLPPETSAALASITDLAELRAAIRAEHEARPH
ncbi:MAG: hypothetical protein FWD57_10315, partial [Polyangiaceae bacterium]|nr:hypothetical protein [Polyangiaceae bacterium]